MNRWYKYKHKKFSTILLSLIGIFLMYNIFWFSWMHIMYSPYAKEVLKQNIGGKVLYMTKDSEGYGYCVKKPDYLSYTGNLGVILPSDEDKPYKDSLIIWPLPFGGYKYGAVLYEDIGDSNMIQYQIYIDSNGQPIDSNEEDIKMIKKHSSSIKKLIEKADEKWRLSR